MLFTATTPTSQGDRIVLFADPDDARKDARDGKTIFGVAVELDASRRRLTPRGELARSADPDWATSAYLEQFGRVMARGPIPFELFRVPSNTLACCR